MKKILEKPIDMFVGYPWNCSQLFAQSRDIYMADFGNTMKFGHNGMDFVASSDKKGYGTKIRAAHKYYSVILESDFPNKTKGNGIYLRGKLDTPILVNGILASEVETCYWHLSDFSIRAGATGNAGDVIGLMGNTGYVWPRPSQASPWDGTHLHFGIRFYHESGNIIPSEFSGNYVDPLPYMYVIGEKIGTQAYLGKDLMIGSYGDEVSVLQSLMSLQGVYDGDPTGQFGPKTFASVVSLQKKYGITPTGYAGPKTRALLNNKYC